MKPAVTVLGGGADAEREVSLESSSAIASALEDTNTFNINRLVIDTLDQDHLAQIETDIFFPALHGPWGEGGPLQDLLEADGRPFVGAGPRAARLAMDKIATKSIALSIGVPTTTSCVLTPADPACPLPLPVVAKPIHEGSTVGLFVCHTEADWRQAHTRAAATGRPYMIEPYIAGRELTVSVLDGAPLPIIEIIPAGGLYDYEAKYTRNDTTYTPHPALPPGVADRISAAAVQLFHALGARHLARIDFILDAAGIPWLLELNTMPGFTDHSLLPMAARAAPPGLELNMPELCAHLVNLALRDARATDTFRSTATWQKHASATI